MELPRIILSFTTFKDRATKLATVLNSIIKQTTTPDEVRCYTELTIEDFPDKIKELLIKAGVKLFPAVATDKGYKKILPVLRDFWEDDVVIILIDDDWDYPPNLVKNLLTEHLKFPNAIISTRGRKISKTRYTRWPFHKGTLTKPHETMILSGSGSLYKPCFFKESVFDDKRKELSPTADDLWLTIQAIIAGTPVISLSAANHSGVRSVPTPVESRLYSVNKTQNDVQWSKLVLYAKDLGIDVYTVLH